MHLQPILEISSNEIAHHTSKVHEQMHPDLNMKKAWIEITRSLK
uniref:Uncharacterized protein n=1 Tax=Arundo donax TaxID=35708 RepID=A0A0A9ACG0_ARUDO